MTEKTGKNVEQLIRSLDDRTLKNVDPFKIDSDKIYEQISRLETESPKNFHMASTLIELAAKIYAKRVDNLTERTNRAVSFENPREIEVRSDRSLSRSLKIPKKRKHVSTIATITPNSPTGFRERFAPINMLVSDNSELFDLLGIHLRSELPAMTDGFVAVGVIRSILDRPRLNSFSPHHSIVLRPRKKTKLPADLTEYHKLHKRPRLSDSDEQTILIQSFENRRGKSYEDLIDVNELSRRISETYSSNWRNASFESIAQGTQSTCYSCSMSELYLSMENDDDFDEPPSKSIMLMAVLLMVSSSDANIVLKQTDDLEDVIVEQEFPSG